VTPYGDRVPAAPRPVIVDTDGGIDDAVALWWALTDPGLEVLAVTTVWGNVGVELATEAVQRVLHAAGREDVPVAVGRARPFGPAPDLKPATFIHGRDGLGETTRPAAQPRPVDEPAVALLHRVFSERPGEVSLVTLGPLTNVAQLVTAAPQVARHVRELVVMGGSFHGFGNALPAAEANIAHDPTAAAAVLAATWAEPPLLVGLDVTHRATFTSDEWALLAEQRNDAAAFLGDPLRFYGRFGGSFTTPDCPCHDLVAVLALADPGLVTDAAVLPVAVCCEPGPAWGATVADHRAPHFARDAGAEQDRPDGFTDCRVALDVDVARFRHLFRRLFGGSE